jgi:hypothetical protein
MVATEKAWESGLTVSRRSLRPQPACWLRAGCGGGDDDAQVAARGGQKGGRARMSRCVAGNMANGRLKTASLAAISGSPFAVC